MDIANLMGPRENLVNFLKSFKKKFESNFDGDKNKSPRLLAENILIDHHLTDRTFLADCKLINRLGRMSVDQVIFDQKLRCHDRDFLATRLSAK